MASSIRKIGNGKYKTSMGIVLTQAERDAFLENRARRAK